MSQFPKNEKKVINDQAVIRAMCPRDTVKWLAQLTGTTLHTARVWAERTVPVYRREELGKKLLDEYYKDMQWREETLLPAILKMAGRGDEVKITTTARIAFAAADLVGAAQRKVESAVDWLESG